MNVIGIVGWSGAGKTTLLTKLIPLLRERGLSVSTLKHAHHRFDVDVPGKDSHAHRLAGASEVLISSGRRFALIHELRGAPEWSLKSLLGKLSPVNLVIIEGFKTERHPKIEIHRQENGKDLLFPKDPHIRAVASDVRIDSCPLPQFDLDDIEAIAAAVMAESMPLADILARLD